MNVESDFNPRPWLDDAPYYKRGGMDIRDVIEAFGLNFNEGNILKYITRQKPGNPKRMDLLKARVHLDREIERIERTPEDALVALMAMHKRVTEEQHAVSEVERMRGTQRPECLSPTVGYWRPQGMEGGSFMSAPSGGAAGQPPKAPHGRHLGPCPDNS
jgi:hypothetical protein